MPDFQIKQKKLKKLPSYYTDIKPATLNKTITIQEPNSLKDTPNDIPSIYQYTSIYQSWSAFNANKTGSPTTNPDTTAMMPMFREDSKSAAMIKHSMDMIWKAVNHLNKGQSIVVAQDQPLYAIAKGIQWQWPEEYGVHKFLIMLGGLHIEMEYLSALGDWLDCSGWVAAITNSEIAKGGVAESFLSGSKVSKTKYAHQVALCALEILLKRAYNEDAPAQPIEKWKRNKENKYPQFKFWS